VNRLSLRTAARDYTTILVLVALCAVLSVATWDEQFPTGATGGQQLAQQIASQARPGASVLIVVRDTAEDAAMAAALSEQLTAARFRVLETIRGQPVDARRAIARASAAGEKIDFIAGNDVTAGWSVFEDLSSLGSSVSEAQVVLPRSYSWPNFLKVSNLLNITNQIVFIAIIAIGMTMVIIAGGIDLSVGSLVALTAVVMARLLRDYAGGAAAGAIGLVVCGITTIVVGGMAGAVNGGFATLLRIPPFIVTLATMSIASGLAFMVTDGETINEVPASIERLTRGAALAGLPNGVVLMLVLYAIAHIVMSRTTFGRYLYAVGGNRKAAWLCGVPVRRVELASYVISGALAGLAGVLMVSQYRSGGPTYGATYELQVIAAVVVGGTSLAGGQGRMFGTLLGALLIAVVQNGMNLMGISSNPQKVVLGLVILAAAVLDRVKQGRQAG
jgi:ribose/xylose/arabinose/galactoside ABC-type transport system permease subunit